MNAVNVVRLLLLSAIWGASFLFMRVAVPVFGPAPMIFLRVALGAAVLAVVAWHLRRPLGLRRHWRYFLVIGLFNSALPWMLYGYSARIVSASLLSILNSTAPMWAALIGAIWLRRGLSVRAAMGLALGVVGVAVLAGREALVLPAGGALAILGALMAACCYGVATVYTRTTESVEPLASALGTMLAATVLTLPMAVPAPWPGELPAMHVLVAVVAMGAVCSGWAFLLYFRLVGDVGPTSALTVAFLIPLFGVFWGAMFLDESVGWHTALGGAVILAGTALVTGFSPRALWRARV